MNFCEQVLAAFQHLDVVYVYFSLDFLVFKNNASNFYNFIFGNLYFLTPFQRQFAWDAAGEMYFLTKKLNSYDIIKYSVWSFFSAFGLYVIKI